MLVDELVHVHKFDHRAELEQTARQVLAPRLVRHLRRHGAQQRALHAHAKDMLDKTRAERKAIVARAYRMPAQPRAMAVWEAIVLHGRAGFDWVGTPALFDRVVRHMKRGMTDILCSGFTGEVMPTAVQSGPSTMLRNSKTANVQRKVFCEDTIDFTTNDAPRNTQDSAIAAGYMEIFTLGSNNTGLVLSAIMSERERGLPQAICQCGRGVAYYDAKQRKGICRACHGANGNQVCQVKMRSVLTRVSYYQLLVRQQLQFMVRKEGGNNVKE
jgi:hypothetical protein